MKKKEQDEETMKKKCKINLLKPYRCHKAYVAHYNWVTAMAHYISFTAKKYDLRKCT
jgi:hypothetical protein